VKTLVVLAMLAGVAAGCSSGAKSTSRVDRCVQRMTAKAHVEGQRAEVEAYARGTYCEPLAAKGFVYADGTLSIGAQHWLVRGGTCATSEAGGTSRTVPCTESGTIDCGMLRYVRRAEVRKYVRQVGVTGCDDGTPLDQLGV
jgi:hypothetical protein